MTRSVPKVGPELDRIEIDRSKVDIDRNRVEIK
jgi:hypothetical protein